MSPSPIPRPPSRWPAPATRRRAGSSRWTSRPRSADPGATVEYDPFADEEPEEEEGSADEGDEEGEGDVLEDTPDFLQETPEHDRLWFEQKPPRDFDFE